MTLGERVARFFVAPLPDTGEDVRWLPPGGERVPRGPAVRVASLVVFCAQRDARVAGGAAALALAHHAGAPAALVLEWTGEPADRADRPATPAARRLATAHEARAAGRLARLTLAADEPTAAAEATTALLHTDAPAVLVVAGPRGAALSAVAAQADRSLLVCRRDDPFAELAAERTGAALIALPSSPGAAALARSGSALVAPLRGPFLEALA